ncbi:MAG: hypothetical protein KKG12_09075 [Gammaproteobacteria bacterium]|nr:hypothetical protein [Gammaproteobacteria bacterium]
MDSDIEEEAQRLAEKLQYWAQTFSIPMSDINKDAASWFEYVTKSDDPQISEFTEFVNAKVALHTPDFPILLIVHLTAAAMSMLSFHAANRPEQPAWRSLISAAEQLSMLEGLVGSSVFEREARSLKLSEGGKKGAQVKHQGISRLKDWAVSEAQGVRGADKEISRQLALKIPAELVGVSKDPERVIYDAIRTARKSKS